jgi:hypothetical protein
MDEFYSTGFDVWARNRFALTNTSNQISIKYQITAGLQAFNFITLSTQSIGTSYVKVGRILVDPGEVNSTTRLRIGCQFTQSGGGIINVPFGIGQNGTNWTFYCGTSSAPYTVSTPPAGDVYLNINVSSGQYPSCG